MTFYCVPGEHVTKPRIKQHKQIIKTRDKIYPIRPNAKDPGGIGWEIVREVNCCIEHLRAEDERG